MALRLRDEATAGFSIRRIPFSQVKGWSLVNGALSHESGGFFSVIGATCDNDPQLAGIYLLQPQQALNGLLMAVIEGERHLLLQVGIEPGNLGGAQFRPTVQATPSNYLRMHNGAATGYVDYFLGHQPGAVPVSDSSHPDLGGRYFMKNKRLVYVEVIDPPPAEAGFAWVSCRVARQLASLGGTVNIDLRSMLALMPWDDFIDDTPSEGVAAALRASLAEPLRADVIGRVMVELQRHAAGAARLDRIVPLSELSGWQFTEDGMQEVDGRQGFDVHFFDIVGPSREVKRWTQPLIDSRSPGRVDLCTRIREGRLEVLVDVRPECGLACSAALLPSVIRYPGSFVPAPLEEALDSLAGTSILLETQENDEGGRFYLDSSTCRVVLLTENIECGPSHAWLTVSELKFLLGRSNTCSIQLRAMASMLLGLL